MFNPILIRNKLFLLLGVALVLMTLLGLLGVYTQKAQNARLEHSLDEAIIAASSIQASDAATIHFKKQVQEWKDLILRGQEQKDFDGYLEAFRREHDAVEQALDRTRTEFETLGLDTVPVREAQAKHAALLSHYLEAAKLYDRRNPTGYQVVDKAVYGIDRQPTEAIDKLSRIVMIALEQRSREAHSGATSGNLALAASALMLILAIAASFVLIAALRVNEKLVAELRGREQALRDSAAQLRLFTENVPAMAVSLDRSLHYVFANRRYAEFFGFDQVDIVGKHLSEVVGEEAYREIEGHFAQVLQGHPVTYQRTHELPNGESRYLEVKLLPHIGDQGEVLGCFGVTTDMTEHKLAEERIQNVAHHDSLTSLPNRLLFNDRLSQAISLAKRGSRQFALLYLDLDLDKFKSVNDTLGHTAGDELLKSVAARIRHKVRESDTVARVGGDEFTVILPDIARREEAEIVAKKIIAAIALPFELGSQQQSVGIGTSIGIALYPADAQDADALVNAADAAMYCAKQAGNGFRFYVA